MTRVPFKHSGKPSKVQQQFRENVDINNIMDRARRTGMISQSNRRPIFGAIPSISFMDAQNMVIDARNAFESLPSRVRR